LTLASGASRSAARRRTRRRRLVGGSVLLLLAAALFLLGVGLGQALEEAPDPGGTRTEIRTLKPLELPPERETVTETVTVTAP
jgi:cytoskeletal protein RodZ